MFNLTWPGDSKIPIAAAVWLCLLLDASAMAWDCYCLAATVWHEAAAAAAGTKTPWEATIMVPFLGQCLGLVLCSPTPSYTTGLRNNQLLSFSNGK